MKCPKCGERYYFLELLNGTGPVVSASPEELKELGYQLAKKSEPMYHDLTGYGTSFSRITQEGIENIPFGDVIKKQEDDV